MLFTLFAMRFNALNSRQCNDHFIMDLQQAFQVIEYTVKMDTEP